MRPNSPTGYDVHLQLWVKHVGESGQDFEICERCGRTLLALHAKNPWPHPDAEEA
jgi:hypothetical protein